MLEKRTGSIQGPRRANAQLGLDFGDMELSLSIEDKPRKSKNLDNTNKSIEIAKKDSAREDITYLSPKNLPLTKQK